MLLVEEDDDGEQNTIFDDFPKSSSINIGQVWCCFGFVWPLILNHPGGKRAHPNIENTRFRHEVQD